MTDPLGVQKLNALREGGFTDDEITQYKTQATGMLREGGFSEDEINTYWGDALKPATALENGVRTNLRNSDYNPETFDATDPKQWLQQLNRGYGSSASGYLPEDMTTDFSTTPTAAWLLQQAGKEIGDFPYQVLGGGIGAIAGSPGGPLGVAAGIGGGSTAVPAYVREHYVDGLMNGAYKDAGDFIARHALITLHATEAGIPGAVLGPVGEVAGPIAGKVAGDVLGATAGKVASWGANFSTWALGGAALNSAMQGRLPSASDFEANALVMGALGLVTHGVMHISGAGKAMLNEQGHRLADKMADVYKDTGITPQELVRTVNDVPAARIALASRTMDNETPTDKFLPYAAPNPKPVIKGTEEAPGAPVPPNEGAANEAQRKLEETKPIETVPNGAVSEENGLRPVTNVSPQRLLPLIKGEKMFDEKTGLRAKLSDPAAFEKVQLDRLRELLPQFKRADGSIDLEGALAAYHAGFGKAAMFRDSGRDYSKLPMETRRFLERVGTQMEQEGHFADEKPTDEQKAAQAALDEKVAEAQKQTDPNKRAAAMPTAALVQNFTRGRGGNPSLPWFKRLPDAYRWARYKWSKLYPAQQFDKMLSAKGEEGVGLDGLMRLQLASGGKFVNRFFSGGLRKLVDKTGHAYYDLDPTVPSMQSVYAEASKREGGLTEFDAVQRAAHTIDQAKTSKTPPANLPDAIQLMQRLGPKWEDLLKKDRLTRDSMIERLIDTNMISKEQASEWRVDHPNWHPEIDEALGEKIRLLNVWEHDAQLNANRKFAAETLAKNGILGAIKATGKEDEVPPFDYGKPPGERPFLGRDTIEWFDNGVRQSAKIVNIPAGLENMADMLMNDHYLQPMFLTKFLGKFGQVFRSMTLINPRTMARILYKDGVQAFISHPDGGLPVKNTFRGLIDVFDQAAKGRVNAEGSALKTLARYEANGGYSMAIAWLDHSDLLKHVREDRMNNLGPLANLKSGVAAVHGFLQGTDAATRVGGIFRKGESKYGTVGAAIQSRLTHGDFQEPATSKSIKWASSVMPFTVARIRGDVDALVRAFATNPKGVLFRGALFGLTVTLPAILLAKKFEKDHPEIPEAQKYSNMPAYQKYLFSHFQFTMGGDVHEMTLPVAWGMGEIFHGAVTSFMDFWEKDDPKSFEEYSKALLDQFMFDDPLIANPGVKPVIETWANRNLDFGGPILNKGEEYGSKYTAYDNNTSRTAVALSQFIGPPGLNILDYPPKFIDRYINDWLGDTGLKALKTVEAPFKEGVQTPKEEWHATMAELSDVWLGSSILRMNTSTQPINDFYELYGRIEAAHADFKKADDKADDEAKIEIMKRPEWQADVADLRKKVKFLSEQRKLAKGIEENKDMTVSEKHQALDNVANMMIVTAKQAVEAAHAVGVK